MSKRKQTGANSPKKNIFNIQAEEKRVDLLSNPQMEEEKTTTTIYEESLEMISNSSIGSNKQNRRKKNYRGVEPIEVYERSQKNSTALIYGGGTAVYQDPFERQNSAKINNTSNFNESQDLSRNSSFKGVRTSSFYK